MPETNLTIEQNVTMLETSAPAVIEVEQRNTILEVEQRETIIEVQPPPFLIEVGKQGPPGPQGTSGATEPFPFAFGDATPALVAMAEVDSLIVSATLIITEAFNGDGAALALGTDSEPALLIATNQNDPTIETEYETLPALTVAAGEEVKLTITPGAGATQGAGYVVMQLLAL